eukprot:sb/3470449/
MGFYEKWTLRNRQLANYPIISIRSSNRNSAMCYSPTKVMILQLLVPPLSCKLRQVSFISAPGPLTNYPIISIRGQDIKTVQDCRNCCYGLHQSIKFDYGTHTFAQIGLVTRIPLRTIESYMLQWVQQKLHCVTYPEPIYVTRWSQKEVLAIPPCPEYQAKRIITALASAKVTTTSPQPRVPESSPQCTNRSEIWYTVSHSLDLL